jgi:hypothetical protein
MHARAHTHGSTKYAVYRHTHTHARTRAHTQTHARTHTHTRRLHDTATCICCSARRRVLQGRRRVVGGQPVWGGIQHCAAGPSQEASVATFQGAAPVKGQAYLEYGQQRGYPHCAAGHHQEAAGHSPLHFPPSEGNAALHESASKSYLQMPGARSASFRGANPDPSGLEGSWKTERPAGLLLQLLGSGAHAQELPRLMSGRKQDRISLKDLMLKYGHYDLMHVIKICSWSPIVQHRLIRQILGVFVMHLFRFKFALKKICRKIKYLNCAFRGNYQNSENFLAGMNVNCIEVAHLITRHPSNLSQSVL